MSSRGLQELLCEPVLEPKFRRQQFSAMSPAVTPASEKKKKK